MKKAGWLVAVLICACSCSEIVTSTDSFTEEVKQLAVASKSQTKNGLAVAIVYDTSGSMGDSVGTANGTKQKFVIANDALKDIVKKLDAFSKGRDESGHQRIVKAELIVFAAGGSDPQVAIPMSDFDSKTFDTWLNSYGGPNANTPLGPSIQIAIRDLVSSGMSKKHLLVITDGMNNRGPNPEKVLPALTAASKVLDSPIPVYFVAFDVNADLFNPVKNLGAAVFSADNEKELNSQLTFIVTKKILLEKEE